MIFLLGSCKGLKEKEEVLKSELVIVDPVAVKSKPESVIIEIPQPEPIMVKPKAVISEFAPVIVDVPKSKLTDKDLLSILEKICKEVAGGEYGELSRNRLKKINIELTKRNISPATRNSSKFDFIACKNPLRSLYMNDLKTYELQWIYVKHYGHEVDNEAVNELCKDIFTNPQFDWEQAMRIAIGSYVDIKDGLKKNLKTVSKLKHLNLPDYMQEELTIFCSDKIIKRRIAAAKNEFKKREAEAEFKVKKLDVKRQLENFLKIYSPDNRDIPSVSECMLIWEAVKIVGSPKKHTAIIREYKNLSGIEIGISKTRRRIILLKKGLIL